jgi:1,2-diacylglycerol 3-beta-galactosyltransferase
MLRWATVAIVVASSDGARFSHPFQRAIRRDDVDVTHGALPPASLVAAAGKPGVSRHGQETSKRKRKILMLISDTGGGHRASANALKVMMQQLRPHETDVKVVDIWTECGRWPHNQMAAGYPWLCRHPLCWRAMYFTSTLRIMEPPWYWWTRTTCGDRFERYIGDYQPDMVVSLHPLCQNLPLQTLRTLKRKGRLGDVPFATVCTDLGSAHPSWFRKELDAVFVPTDAVRRVALKRGVASERVVQHGLPVREEFWTPTAKRTDKRSSRPGERGSRSGGDRFTQLGLDPNKKTVLIIGGGDGVGSLGPIVDATASQLSSSLPAGQAQVVAICGKNQRLAATLDAKSATSNAGAWEGVHVAVRGFTSQISQYMEVADCLVTKAGPGTIAEATTRGLPTMLSSFLPGQEAGNVPFVLQHGFGEFARRPKRIAERVTAWLQDEPKLQQMSDAAYAAAAPEATRRIAADLLRMLDEGKPSSQVGPR